MTLHLKDKENLRDIGALYFKDRGVLRTITEVWYKENNFIWKVYQPVVIPDAEAPQVTINSIGGLNAGDSVELNATVGTDGLYDSLTYTWSVTAGSGYISGSGPDVIYHAQEIIGSNVEVRCEVVAKGTGTNAAQGTIDTSEDHEIFVVQGLTTGPVGGKPDAEAPTVTLVSDQNTVEVNGVVNFATSITGGEYDTLEYDWTIIIGGGSFTGGSGGKRTFTAGTVAGNVTVECTVTVTGIGITSRASTSDSRSVTKTITVTGTTGDPPPELTARAVAPQVSIAAIADQEPLTTLRFDVDLDGGTYDAPIEYAWSIVSGGGTIVGSTTDSRNFWYMTPASAATVVIQCVVSVRGYGRNAVSGTTDDETAIVTFDVLEDPDKKIPLPNTSAPTISIAKIADKFINASVPIVVNVSGGKYDTLVYTWQIRTGGGRISGTTDTIIYTAASVPAAVRIRCTVTAEGSGNISASGTSDTAVTEVTFDVNKPPAPPPPPVKRYNATAPTITLPKIITQMTGALVPIIASLRGGSYDEIEYTWVARTGGGSFTGKTNKSLSAIYQASETPTTATLSFTASVKGTGLNALANTNDSNTESVRFEVVAPRPPPIVLISAIAPGIVVNAVSSVDEDETTTILATVTTQSGYDTIEYFWSVTAGSIVGGGASVTYVPPNIAMGEDGLEVTIACRVVVTGTGTRARSGTSDSARDTDTITINWVDMRLPITQAPMLAIDGPIKLKDTDTADFTATFVGGRHDDNNTDNDPNNDATFAWAIVTGGGRIDASGQTVTYTPTNVLKNTMVTIECTITVRGRGITARDGTSATKRATKTFQVINDFVTQVELQLDHLTIDEDGGIATITARANPVFPDSFTVTVTATAIAPATSAHFTQTGTTLSFRDSVTLSSGTVRITAIDNMLDDADRVLRISGVTSNSEIPAPKDVLLTIQDDEVPEVPKVVLHATPDSISESAEVSTITASLNQSVSVPVTVTVTAVAVAPTVAGDFTQTGTTLSFAANATASTGTVTITSVDNDDDAPNRLVRISGNASTTVVENPSDINLILVDDDEPVPPGPQPTEAPDVNILSAASAVNETDTLAVTASISGGLYDSLAFAWRVISGGGTFDEDTHQMAMTYRAPRISTNTLVTIGCTVTAHGEGEIAINGDTDTSSDTHSFGVVNLRLPEAPIITLKPVTAITENEIVNLVATIGSDGEYDTLKYVWSVSTGSGSISKETTTTTGATATYTPVDIEDAVTVTIQCTVTANVSATTALPNPVPDSQSDTVSFIVNPVKGLEVVAPTVSINPVGDVDLGGAVDITAAVTGGRYDTLKYAWRVRAAAWGTPRGVVLPRNFVAPVGSITGTSSTARYVAPASADERLSSLYSYVYVQVTAKGTGTNAIIGSEDTSTEIQRTFEITLPKPTPALPDASVKVLLKVDHAELNTDAFPPYLEYLDVTAQISGVYDTAKYSWATSTGRVSGIGASVRWIVPRRGHNFRLECIVNVAGTGTKAKDGTTATVKTGLDS